MTKRKKKPKRKRQFEAKWLPSPQEIAEEAAKIREENMANHKVTTTCHEDGKIFSIKTPHVYKTPDFKRN